MLTAVLCMAVWGLSAQANIKISIQGTFKDANNAAVDDGAYETIFRLYTSSTGGTAIWEESATVQLTGGVYTHRLGTTTPLSSTDFDTTLFVGVNINGIEISPRTELTYAPYTLHSPYATRAGNDVFIGSILPFAGPLAKVPAGYLPCDGRAMSSTEYPELFAAIGTTWGNGTQNNSGGGVKDFNLPRTGGLFLRGWGAGNNSEDPNNTARTASLTGGAAGNNVGSFQGDAFKQHNHDFNSSTQSDGAHGHSVTDVQHGFMAGETFTFNGDGGGNAGQQSATRNVNFGGQHSHSVSGTTQNNSGSTPENRPKNISVLYIIKARL